jgi:cytochrome c oxidase subunit 1
LLSLFISVPTIAVFLVIVISLEAHARAGGAKGLFGWMRGLPWAEPAISAMGWSVLNLALGGIFAFVLIQEKLAPLLSDTFFVPAYFHFLTVGTVSLTLIGALAWAIPVLFGRRIIAPALLARLPLALSAGLLAFGGGGMVAGLSGMPRRVIDPTYEGAAPELWSGMSPLIAAGAVLMIAALAAYTGLLAISALWGPAATQSDRGDRLVKRGAGVLTRQRAWTAPLALVLLVAGMYVATLVAFALLRSLPLGAAAAGH